MIASAALVAVLFATFLLAGLHGQHSFWGAVCRAFAPLLLIAIVVSIIFIVIGYQIRSTTDIIRESATLFELQKAIDRATKLTDTWQLKGWKLLVMAISLTCLVIALGIQRVRPIIRVTSLGGTITTFAHILCVFLASVTFFGTVDVAQPLVDRQLRLRDMIKENDKILGVSVQNMSKQFTIVVAQEACKAQASNGKSVCDYLEYVERAIRDVEQIRRASAFSSTPEFCTSLDVSSPPNLVYFCSHATTTPSFSSAVIAGLSINNWLKPTIDAAWRDVPTYDLEYLHWRSPTVEPVTPLEQLESKYIEAGYDVSSDSAKELVKNALKAFSEASGIPEQFADAVIDISLNEQIKATVVETANRLLSAWIKNPMSARPSGGEDVLSEFRKHVSRAMHGSPVLTQAVAKAYFAADRLWQAVSVINARWAAIPDAAGAEFSSRAAALEARLSRVLEHESGKPTSEITRYAHEVVQDNLKSPDQAAVGDRDRRLVALEAKFSRLETSDRHRKLQVLAEIAGGSTAQMPDGITPCTCNGVPPVMLCFESQIGSPC
jgi:hypothetical protein